MLLCVFGLVRLHDTSNSLCYVSEFDWSWLSSFNHIIHALQSPERSLITEELALHNGQTPSKTCNGAVHLELCLHSMFLSPL